MNTISLARLSARFIVLAGLLFPLAAQAQDSIGRIIKTSGVVSAVDAAGASRPLARGSEFFVGETITTGGDGTVEFRMNDGAVLSMTEDAAFVVTEFQNDGPGGAADTAVMSMVRGAMRTISGTIGESQGDTYRLDTPFASIGIRGTEYAVRVQANGRTFVIVFDGGVALTAGGTTTNLGLDGDADAAEVVNETGTIEVVDVADAPAEVQTLVELIIAEITEAEVNTLPAPEQALEVQLQQQQQQNQQQQQQNQPPAQQQQAQATGGALVDAQGNALAVTTETQVQEAREVVVVTVTRVNPAAFSSETLKSVSKN